MRVTTPAGEAYHVHRRWLPWRPRTRDLNGAEGLGWDLPDVGDELPVVAVVLAVIAVIVLLPVVLIGLVLLGELLVLLLLLPAFVLARVAFGKPWIVEVVRARRVVHAEPVTGWRNAGRRVRELAAQLRSGTADGAAAPVVR